MNAANLLIKTLIFFNWQKFSLVIRSFENDFLLIPQVVDDNILVGHEPDRPSNVHLQLVLLVACLNCRFDVIASVFLNYVLRTADVALGQ